MLSCPDGHHGLPLQNISKRKEAHHADCFLFGKYDINDISNDVASLLPCLS